ncbi:hypothetical protein Pcinc_005383 [Petrolisthes cinctipes]|uniref:Uncharacterized protein n=1 Tax=Petrolisthes cinctipes TaxID=88211 RepID=A0AAE1GF93_PETCI|nr:hypothetical protein Pcinc_005383 [Petrolisthes cinctipes]
MRKPSHLRVTEGATAGGEMILENLWGSIVNTWEPERERTTAELLRHTRAQWEIFRGKPDIVRRHGASMPERLQAVIEKEGGWTRY